MQSFNFMSSVNCEYRIIGFIYMSKLLRFRLCYSYTLYSLSCFNVCTCYELNKHFNIMVNIGLDNHCYPYI